MRKKKKGFYCKVKNQTEVSIETFLTIIEYTNTIITILKTEAAVNTKQLNKILRKS